MVPHFFSTCIVPTQFDLYQVFTCFLADILDVDEVMEIAVAKLDNNSPHERRKINEDLGQVASKMRELMNQI